MTGFRPFPTKLFACALVLAAAVPALAQDKKEKEPPPEPKTVDLTTLQVPQVKLKGTFYGSNEGKDAVPIILLHMYGGSRADWAGIAPALQAEGYAVLTLDLRGHGDSTEVIGFNKPLSYKNLRQHDFQRMVTDDVEVAKAWLLGQNNAGNVNIEKLTIVGAEMGAVIATLFAAQDWSWPPLASGKQGQDVKALVLMSPQLNFRGLRVDAAMNHQALQRVISLQVIYGEKDRTAKSAALAIKRLASKHRETEFKTDEERRKNLNLFVDAYPTSLAGTKMLGKNLKLSNAPLESRISAFIRFRAADQEFPWKERINPLAN